MKMKDALKEEIEFWGHKCLMIRSIGYKAIEGNTEWTVCPDHGMAHPIDFPCKMCDRERFERKPRQEPNG